MTALPKVAAIVLLRADGAALLQHRDDKPGLSHRNKWTPPGGHSDPGEALEDCARREFLEETDYLLGDLHLFAQFVDDNPVGCPPLELFVFWSRYDGRQPVACHEGQALEFISRSRAGEYDIPQYLVDLWDRALGAAGREVNLLDRYPRGRRPLADNRGASDAFKLIARRFGPEYFDGDRTTGYGGYRYDGRWVPIAERIRDFYGLRAGHRVLDVGCAKGFLMHDLSAVVPGIEVVGLDISAYALGEAMPGARGRLVRGHAARLPFADGTFDLVLSINTLHNLDRDTCIRALADIERVSRRWKYVQVDSWLTDEQRINLDAWLLTALTVVSPDDWRVIFQEAGYTGDYYWTLTE